MTAIYITPEDHNILLELLSDLSCEVLVFGSRIKGTHQKFSDLDLCLKSNKPIPLTEIALLKDSLRQSNLPFTVDVIDFHAISEGFKNIVDRDGIDFKVTTPSLTQS